MPYFKNSLSFRMSGLKKCLTLDYLQWNTQKYWNWKRNYVQEDNFKIVHHRPYTRWLETVRKSIFFKTTLPWFQRQIVMIYGTLIITRSSWLLTAFSCFYVNNKASENKHVMVFTHHLMVLDRNKRIEF